MNGPAPILRTVLWDLDGTLMDSAQLWRAAEYAFLDARGLGWSDEHSARLVGGNLERVSRIFEEVTGRYFSVEELRGEMAAAVLKAVTAEVPWMPGARALVRGFSQAGIRQGIVTSSFRDIATIVAEATDGAVDAALVVSRDDVVHPKPAAEPYLLAASRVVDTHRPILAIEDSPSGVASAVAAGLWVLAVGEHVADGLGNAWVSTLAGLSAEQIARLISLETSDD